MMTFTQRTVLVTIMLTALIEAVFLLYRVMPAHPAPAASPAQMIGTAAARAAVGTTLLLVAR